MVEISLKFVSNGPIDSKSALVQVHCDGFALQKRKAIIITNADPVHRRIYAALGGGGGG